MRGRPADVTATTIITTASPTDAGSGSGICERLVATATLAAGLSTCGLPITTTMTTTTTMMTPPTTDALEWAKLVVGTEGLAMEGGRSGGGRSRESVRRPTRSTPMTPTQSVLEAMDVGMSGNRGLKRKGRRSSSSSSADSSSTAAAAAAAETGAKKTNYVSTVPLILTDMAPRFHAARQDFYIYGNGERILRDAAAKAAEWCKEKGEPKREVCSRYDAAPIGFLHTLIQWERSSLETSSRRGRESVASLLTLGFSYPLSRAYLSVVLEELEATRDHTVASLVQVVLDMYDKAFDAPAVHRSPGDLRSLKEIRDALQEALPDFYCCGAPVLRAATLQAKFKAGVGDQCKFLPVLDRHELAAMMPEKKNPETLASILTNNREYSPITKRYLEQVLANLPAAAAGATNCRAVMREILDFFDVGAARDRWPVFSTKELRRNEMTAHPAVDKLAAALEQLLPGFYHGDGVAAFRRAATAARLEVPAATPAAGFLPALSAVERLARDAVLIEGGGGPPGMLLQEIFTGVITQEYLSYLRSAVPEPANSVMWVVVDLFSYVAKKDAEDLKEEIEALAAQEASQN